MSTRTARTRGHCRHRPTSARRERTPPPRVGPRIFFVITPPPRRPRQRGLHRPRPRHLCKAGTVSPEPASRPHTRKKFFVVFGNGCTAARNPGQGLPPSSDFCQKRQGLHLIINISEFKALTANCTTNLGYPGFEPGASDLIVQQPTTRPSRHSHSLTNTTSTRYKKKKKKKIHFF